MLLGQDAKYRYVYFDGSGLDRFSAAFCSNVVVTSKYSALGFLPKFLYESFRLVANGFFLVVSALQCVPSISNTGGIPTTAPVLLFILMVDAVFAVLEDLGRHRADALANATACHIFDPKSGSFVDRHWRDLRVGQVVKIRNRETVPADVLLLSVCEQDKRNPTGVCYVETKSLDGETNLKQRQSPQQTMLALTPKMPLGPQGTLECSDDDDDDDEDDDGGGSGLTGEFESGMLQLLKGFTVKLQCETPNDAINSFAGTFSSSRYLPTHPPTCLLVLLL